MTDRERFEKLWEKEQRHVDEHRYLSKRLDEIDAELKRIIVAIGMLKDLIKIRSE